MIDRLWTVEISEVDGNSSSTHGFYTSEAEAKEAGETMTPAPSVLGGTWKVTVRPVVVPLTELRDRLAEKIFLMAFQDTVTKQSRGLSPTEAAKAAEMAFGATQAFLEARGRAQ